MTRKKCLYLIWQAREAQQSYIATGERWGGIFKGADKGVLEAQKGR